MNKKKLDKSIIRMTNVTFIEQMNLLFDLESKVGEFKNDYSKRKTSKKKIAIVYDFDGWAFCNIANQIKKYLLKYFEIDIFPVSVFDDNTVKLLILAKEYDLVHCLWRGLISCIDTEYIRGYIYNMGIKYEEFVQEYLINSNITTSVYDHKFLDDNNFGYTRTFAKYCKNYTVSSSVLKEIYDNLQIDKKPTMVISDGVNLERFKPDHLERFELENIKNRTINIGWVGNSEFTDSEGDDDLKGVRKIINPAIQELIEEGYNICKKFADRKEEYIPHDKMPEYYNKIDLYICTSKNEGTPNPVLESMASGIPIISTDVGIVRDAFGEKQEKYIMKERTKEELKEKIKKILSNKNEFKLLSEENLKYIQNWTWEKKCYQFKEFFEKNLGSK